METLNIDSLADLPRAAHLIIDRSASQGVVAFYGAMGAGKTTLIKEICRLLGVTDTVTSPTFALVNEYHAGDGSPVFHFDFYRIEDVREAFDMGYEEYFYSGELCLVEWPEKIEGLLPEDVLTVRIDIIGDDNRSITIL